MENHPPLSDIDTRKSFAMRGEREREEGKEAIKLILMTLIRRSGSPANRSIKLMTLGLFCHHLGSVPPSLSVSHEC